jgi:Stealth protein CR2, conserved region 2/Stealth protein CR1, conserved region 1
MTQIDAVITWVDGDEPRHRHKREGYMARAETPLHENGINPHRWTSNDELGFCLRSIANNAKWIRHVWIVTDAQSPDLSGLPADFRKKIKLVDHQELFEGHHEVLPTFNSLAIESLLWRIPDLAEKFIYFNDDVFLTAALCPQDFFRGEAPVLRGKWVDYSDLENDIAQRSDPALFNHYTQINAAGMLGFHADHLFATAHVVHPLRRSVMAQLFENHTAAFLQNITYRFRDLSQFVPQSLHNHACILDGQFVIETAEDHLHLRTGAVLDYPLEDVRAYLRKALEPQFKFLCINDLPQLENAISDTRDWIERAIASSVTVK